MEISFCNAKDDREMTLLHLAGQNGHVAVIEALLTFGSAVTTKDSYGKTTYDRAAQEGHAAAIWQLCKAEAQAEKTRRRSAAAAAEERGRGPTIAALVTLTLLSSGDAVHGHLCGRYGAVVSSRQCNEARRETTTKGAGMDREL